MTAAADTTTPRKADAFLVSCIDPRLTDDTTFLMAALGRTDRYSEMRIAGAALAAVDPARPAWNTALWENLAASRQLHGVREVIFVNHRDCGAMHGWAGRRLSDDPADELRQHHGVLERAAAAVRARHPDLGVTIKLMELDGSARVLPCAACGPAGGLRAEAVDPAGGPGDPAVLPVRPGAAAFADLVRLRAGGGLTDPDAELALLTDGVVQHGLTAAEARAVLLAEARRSGTASGSAAAAEARAFLRAQADPRGRVARTDALHAAALYRRVTGRQATEAEATRRVATLIEAEGLAPRPDGVLRSTTWFRRMAQA
ncbi:hypothetical protein [Roseomonas sp. CECT 9278]|uniref:hypothetical protein n=1 Tax=Roseomonas sp. CECT 9278 TaxID=2845823 RepID=UPI001E4B6666|nr:hypothetical protein [Roseomonas sp. CECT 9278]CAH0224158.1 hypothetical protein ROS9278_02484 [Roseomonas sp. CECT 9278]